jgi:hypothetical protein
MVKQGSGKETKNTAERGVAKLMPLSDLLTPITTFRSDYGLRKQVCLFSSFYGNWGRRKKEGGRGAERKGGSCLSWHSCLSPPPFPECLTLAGSPWILRNVLRVW